MFTFCKVHMAEAFIFIFWLPGVLFGILVLWPGAEPGPSTAKVLSPNYQPPGNSQQSFQSGFIVGKFSCHKIHSI